MRIGGTPQSGSYHQYLTPTGRSAERRPYFPTLPDPTFPKGGLEIDRVTVHSTERHVGTPHAVIALLAVVALGVCGGAHAQNTDTTPPSFVSAEVKGDHDLGDENAVDVATGLSPVTVRVIDGGGPSPPCRADAGRGDGGE